MNNGIKTAALKDRCAKRVKTILIRTFILVLIPCSLLLTPSCNPDAYWTTQDVTIGITPLTVSAGYIECSFSTNKEAYYLVACVPAKEGYDPTLPENQKPFMSLAIDSAEMEYINWRYSLLQSGEFNIAPFSSHALQYGNITKFFTNLTPGTDYWVYAFVVNPDTQKPSGKLYLQRLTTTESSIVDVHFEYRVKGVWDYIYPLNPDGKINNHFPYMAATVDSLALPVLDYISPEDYFSDLFLTQAELKDPHYIRYGVQVVKNDGWDSYVAFEEGHTYYTAIVSFDGFIGNNVIYKFTWTGDDYEAYFTDEDSIASDGEDE